MRFATTTLLAALALGASSVTALQNIYIGEIDGCSSNKYGPDWYAWFTDGPACSTGTDLGPTSAFGNGLCNQPVTILGHSGLTFTGCSPPAPPYGIPGVPTGVSDDGAPALTCHPVSIPNQKCPSPCGYPYPDVTVKTKYICS